MDKFLLVIRPSKYDRLTATHYFATLTPMTRLTKKFVAILMLLWLPVFTGSALAATVSMQLPQAACHEASAHEDMGEQHQHHGDPSPIADEHTPSCNACGVCHLACTGYMAAPELEMSEIQASTRESTPYLVAIHSFTSAPLVPPPLARA